MKSIGVIEGFFGPQWPMTSRMSYAEFLKAHGGDFYIYAPKQDPNLRKKWRSSWSDEYLSHLLSMASHFHEYGIKFGVGFSPFGLGAILTNDDKSQLEEKLSILNRIGIDVLGLFFDDMPVNDNLAATQIAALRFVQQHFAGKIIFCPSYYTPDPILDKVFGQRPVNYLNDIAIGISSDVSIAWTGPKVISPEIDSKHLKETSLLLKRKPFIWENLFANDGPKNCKFLKLKAFSGRSKESFEETSGFGFNMMNQAELSKILYLSSRYVLDGETEHESAFLKALDNLCSPELKNFLLQNQESLLTKGLDNFSDDEKRAMIDELQHCPDLAAHEIIDWLNGLYNVGSDCLTD